MREPYLTQFKELVRRGAGTLDIHDSAAQTPYTRSIRADEALVEREVGRVAIHQKSLCPILERYVGPASRILDLGCSTGGTAVAMALSPVLSPDLVVGIDPNELSLEAAAVRARMHDAADKVSFGTIKPGAPLPFEDGAFDLAVCVSVLEYVHRKRDRHKLVEEMKRVTRAGGHILLITPNPFRIRDYHTRRWLGDLRRHDGYPWSSPPWDINKMLSGCEIIPLRAFQLLHGLKRLGLPAETFPEPLDFLGWALPWQKVLARKP